MAHAISVVIPVKNEAHNLPACLESVTWADEVLVADSHSTDGTAQVARQYGARVVDFDQPGHLTDKKRWALEQASHNWVLSLDADERITPGLRDEIAALLRGEPRHEGYWIGRRNFAFGYEVRHGGWGQDKVIRLFRRDRARYNDNPAHGQLLLDSAAGSLRHSMEHHTYQSLDEYWVKMRRYAQWSAQAMAEQGRRAGALDLLTRPGLRFLRMYVLRGGFRDGGVGLVLAGLAACSVFAKYAQLWLLQHGGGGAAGDADLNA